MFSTTTVSCRVDSHVRESLRLLASANGVNTTDLLRRLIDAALADVPADLTPPAPAPAPAAPDHTAALDAIRSDLASLRSDVVNLTAMVRTLTTTTPTLTLNVPSLAPVTELAQRQLDAADARDWATNRRWVLSALIGEQRADRQLIVRVVDDESIWVWRPKLGNPKRANFWLDRLADACGCDPRPFVSITPDARDSTMGELLTPAMVAALPPAG